MNYLRQTSGLWFPEPCYNLPGMIPGPGLTGSKGAPVAIALTDSQANGSGTTLTHTAAIIGPAVQDRIVVECVGSRDNSNSNTIDTVTVGGNAMTKLREDEYVAGSNFMNSSIWSRHVPPSEIAGTTADIVVTYSESIQRGGMVTYTMTGTGNSPTPSATGGDDTNDPLTTTVTVGADGGAIGCGFENGGAGDDATWTGLGEDIDFDNSSATTTTASSVFDTLQTDLAVEIEWATANNQEAFTVVAFAKG